MLVMCHENVLRFAAIDCSSPMSAKTDLEDRHRRARLGRNVQAGLRHQRQQPAGLERDGLAAGVRAGDDEHARRRDDQRRRPATGSRRAATRVPSSIAACARPPPGSAADGARRAARGGRRSRAPARLARHASAKPRLGLDDVELGGGVERARAGRRRAARKASVSASRMRWTSAASCSSSATISLFSSTVRAARGYRLAPLAELPWTMPGIESRCSDLHDEHVAAVAIGDDLVLQIARGVAAAHVRLERAAQPRRAGGAVRRGSGAAPGWRGRRRRRRGSMARRTSAISRSKRRQTLGQRRQRREAPGAAAAGSAPRTWSIESRTSARPRSRSGSSGRSATVEGGERLVEVRGRPQREGRMVAEQLHAFRRLGERGVDFGAVTVRVELADALGAPSGVSAKLASASRTRSNSRARRVPGCMRWPWSPAGRPAEQCNRRF